MQPPSSLSSPDSNFRWCCICCTSIHPLCEDMLQRQQFSKRDRELLHRRPRLIPSPEEARPCFPVENHGFRLRGSDFSPQLLHTQLQTTHCMLKIIFRGNQWNNIIYWLPCSPWLGIVILSMNTTNRIGDKVQDLEPKCKTCSLVQADLLHRHERGIDLLIQFSVNQNRLNISLKMMTVPFILQPILSQGLIWTSSFNIWS